MRKKTPTQRILYRSGKNQVNVVRLNDWLIVRHVVIMVKRIHSEFYPDKTAADFAWYALF